MLLLLAEYLQQFHKGFAVFQYLSLRGILGVLTALVLSLWMGPWLIRTLTRLKMGQYREAADNLGYQTVGTQVLGRNVAQIVVFVYLAAHAIGGIAHNMRIQSMRNFLFDAVKSSAANK